MDEHIPAEASSGSRICRAFRVKLQKTPDRARRQTILAACAKIRLPWAEELLWDSLSDPNEGIRDFIVRELGRRETLNLELALKRLKRPPWYARSSALAVIGRRRVREAVPEMGPAVDDANADVRRAAAEALGEIGGPECLGFLVRLRKDANPHVRAAAEEAIGKTSGVRIT